MSHCPHDVAADDMDTLPRRLWSASEQLRLTATAMAALAELVDEQDAILLPHVGRLEQRAAELMRTALRLARDVGMAERWGLDVLFVDPEPTPLPRPVAPANETIELEPLELMDPVPPPVRSATAIDPRLPSWMPLASQPAPPAGRLTTAAARHSAPLGDGSCRRGSDRHRRRSPAVA